MICLFEILVPATINCVEVPLAYHKEWDKKVEKIATGLTILSFVKGQWKGLVEPMIPVRVACDVVDMYKIAIMTKEHYKQQQVMYYKLSEEVYFI